MKGGYMNINLMTFLHFMLFLLAPEDSSQWGSSSSHACHENDVTNTFKFLFWFTLSIVLSLMISKLH